MIKHCISQSKWNGLYIKNGVQRSNDCYSDEATTFTVNFITQSVSFLFSVFYEQSKWMILFLNRFEQQNALKILFVSTSKINTLVVQFNAFSTTSMDSQFMLAFQLSIGLEITFLFEVYCKKFWWKEMRWEDESHPIWYLQL